MHYPVPPRAPVHTWPQAFIDNSLEAWHGRARRQGANPRVSIAFHDGDTPALVIEDNGRGMSLREATNSIRLGYPGQRPAEDQEALTGMEPRTAAPS